MDPSAAPGAIYRRLGVEPIVNGRSTFTILGGSLMPPEVLEAMGQAAACFVDLTELQDAVGRRLAELTRNEAAFVSKGRIRLGFDDVTLVPVGERPTAEAPPST